ncbi:MAG: metal ABC transporter permease, partial [Alsobacter sp.]
IPPAAARFWSDRLGVVVTIAALFGAVSAYVGAALSAVLPNVPTGAVIVLCAAALFAISMLAGRARGLLPLAWGRRRRTLRATGIEAAPRSALP